MGSGGADGAARFRLLLTTLAFGLLATSAALAFAAFSGPGSALSSPVQGSASPPSATPTTRDRPAPGAPHRLRVPRLGVDTTVRPITAVGTVLTPPADAQQVGWWRDGAKPGAGRGRVLITGHTVHNGRGAFDHLGRLQPGDRVEVATAHGRQRTYRVVRVLFLTPGRLAHRSGSLFRQSSPEQLVLVTCAAWDGAAYEGSTVVIATPEVAPWVERASDPIGR